MPPLRPVVTKQNPNGERRVPGSILAEAIDASELQDDWIKMVIYGQNRVGKTTLACTFPKPLLLISCEPNKTGGALSIKKVEGVKCLRITSTDQYLKLVGELAADRYFKTHVIDTVTSLQDIVLKEILGLEALPEQLSFGMVSGDQYRARSERVRELLRPLLNLTAHTVVLAKEKDHNPPKEERVNEKTGKVQPDMRPRFLRGMQIESFFAADLGGATVGWLHDACDYIGRLYFDKEVKVEEKTVKVLGKESVQRTTHETGRHIRCLRTMYHPNFAAGFRSATPEKVPECIEEPTYAKILSVIQGK